MKKMLIVGGGITGAVTSALIKNLLQNDYHISIWDNNKHVGGRMLTIIHENSSVDLGAQYISPDEDEFRNHQLFYKELADCGLLKPRTCRVVGEKAFSSGTRHFIAPRGLSSLVQHFCEKSGSEVKLSHQVDSISLKDRKYEVLTVHGYAEEFDGVILTTPFPQVLQLKGIISELFDSKPDLKDSLGKVEYSTRYAVGLFYEPGTTFNLDWSIKYFDDDPIIRYIAVDHEKRGADSPGMWPSLVVHTTVPFGLENLSAKYPDSVCLESVLPQVRRLLPDLPDPVVTRCQHWKYSQVFKCFEGAPGALVLKDFPLLIAGGDSFSYSKFDGCIRSAAKISDVVNKLMQKGNCDKN